MSELATAFLDQAKALYKQNKRQRIEIKFLLGLIHQAEKKGVVFTSNEDIKLTNIEKKLERKGEYYE